MLCTTWDRRDHEDQDHPQSWAQPLDREGPGAGREARGVELGVLARDVVDDALADVVLGDQRDQGAGMDPVVEGHRVQVFRQELEEAFGHARILSL